MAKPRYTSIELSENFNDMSDAPREQQFLLESDSNTCQVPDDICYQKFHTVGETKRLSFEGIFHLQAEHPSFYLNYAHCLHNICESFIDVTQQNPKTGNTFLHYACENQVHHFEANSILNLAQSFQNSNEDITRFIGTLNNKNQTALELALNKGNYRAVEFLLLWCKNVGCSESDIIFERFSNKLLRTFENDLKLTAPCIDSSSYMWTLECEFRNIIARHSLIYDPNKNPCETQETSSLSIIFALNTENQREILMDPLVQTFIFVKSNQYRWLIRFSILYHIVWSLISSWFIVSTINASKYFNHVANPKSELIFDDITFRNDTNATGTWQNEYGIPILQFDYYWQNSNRMYFFLTFFLIALLKEGLEIFNCPSARFYWQQYENIGQWIVLLVSVIAAIHTMFGMTPYLAQIFLSLIYSVGLAASLLLIQGQFSKTQNFGVYNQMMAKSFTKLLKFIFTFSPMLGAYIFILHILMPSEYSMNQGVGIGRIFAMLSGELEFADVFSEDTLSSNAEINDNQLNLNVIPTVIVFCSFIFSVVILLQNILVGLTVSNIEALQEEANVAHVASLLEAIVLLESFIHNEYFQRFLISFRFKEYIFKRIMLINPVKDYDGDLVPYEIAFSELPKTIQENIKKKKYKIEVKNSRITSCFI